MRNTHQRLAVFLLLGLGGTALAAQAPAGATAKCKDGTYSTATSSRGRCSAHGGVAQLLNTTSTSTSSSATTTQTPTTTSTAAGGVPIGAKFQCKDGSYSTAKTSRGACSKHGGVDHALTAAAGAAAAPAERAAPAAAAGQSHAGGKAPTVARPSDAPATATAKCKDGTYSESKQHSGACSHHGGVAEWYQ